MQNLFSFFYFWTTFGKTSKPKHYFNINIDDTFLFLEANVLAKGLYFSTLKTARTQ